MDADMVVRVDGVLEEAVIRLRRGQDMDVFWDFGPCVIPEIGPKPGPKLYERRCAHQFEPYSNGGRWPGTKR